jgi:1-deoxy-D-xylulose-5-phosphate reductoisomerase
MTRARHNVVILGSTGSIGRSTLDVIAALPERFRVLGLAAGRNAALLQAQVEQFQPEFAACGGDQALRDTTMITGGDPLTILATLDEADIVVVATSGHAAIVPTIRALEAGKIVALANKETIVAAGEIVMRVARQRPGSLRPVDSELSAFWQCLSNDRVDARVRRLLLTASGGPFRGWTSQQLRRVTPEMALQHPTWNMGPKVTIDSATLMNKGLEMIEARWLFDCPLKDIDVVIHPQSLVHSLVEFVDGSLIAQIASHDMRLPIQYALTWPDRIEGPAEHLSLIELGRLEFEPPDPVAFPATSLARQSGDAGSTYPAVFSSADTIAVDGFLRGELPFHGITDVVGATLDAHVPASGALTLDAIADADRWATEFAQRIIHERGSRWS